MNSITVQELKGRLDKGETVHLLDVREPHERAEFNIGGEFVPLGRVGAMDVDEIEPWKDEEIVVYCRSGNRSGQACMILEQMGFAHVSNLSGGMLAWESVFGR